jgi:hypothetical protein
MLGFNKNVVSLDPSFRFTSRQNISIETCQDYFYLVKPKTND